jgi:sugar phosphate isomerase/epimerase
VESAIGFAEWIVDDDARRAKGLERARHDMDLVQQIGGKRIAAPPAGATDVADLDYLKAAERYHALLTLGDHIGVVPQVEVWGFSKTLNRLGQTLLVAVESGHPQACVLPDVYHLYKGGSDFAGLSLVSGQAMHVIHMNDYPAAPPRQAISDSDRVYPGAGVAPLVDILKTLHAVGFNGYLSIELFNQSYWRQDPLEVARLGLTRMQTLVRQVGNSGGIRD